MKSSQKCPLQQLALLFCLLPLIHTENLRIKVACLQLLAVSSFSPQIGGHCEDVSLYLGANVIQPRKSAIFLYFFSVLFS